MDLKFHDMNNIYLISSFFLQNIILSPNYQNLQDFGKSYRMYRAHQLHLLFLITVLPFPCGDDNNGNYRQNDNNYPLRVPRLQPYIPE